MTILVESVAKRNRGRGIFLQLNVIDFHAASALNFFEGVSMWQILDTICFNYHSALISFGLHNTNIHTKSELCFEGGER